MVRLVSWRVPVSVSRWQRACRARLRRGAVAGSSRTCRVSPVMRRSPERVNASRMLRPHYSRADDEARALLHLRSADADGAVEVVDGRQGIAVGSVLVPVSYTHLTLRRIERCRSRWSPYD